MELKIHRMKNEVKAYDFGGAAFDPKHMDPAWAALDEAKIDDYPWTDMYPDTFAAFARAGINENGLQVLMYAEETPILSDEKRFGGMPCLDSCVEFFFTPFPGEDPRYINIEINPDGIAHIGVGVKGNRYVYDREVPYMTINTSRYDGKTWAVSFNVPESLIYAHFGRCFKAGDTVKGNFYKCSGGRLHEHYGCWNHVTNPRPDFHRPEFFGDLIIE